MTQRDQARILVIGLDSFDPSRAEAWMAEGWLPNLARHMSASVSGRVRNPRNLDAGSVWPSFCYGADPSVHGIFDGSRDLATVAERRGAMPEVRPIWSVLEDAGKRTMVIEVPVVPEGADAKGIRVINWFSHHPQEGRSRLVLRTHPPELRDRIVRDYGEDPLDGRPCDYYQPSTAEEIAWFRDALVQRVRAKTALSVDLMRQEAWDFCLVNFEDSHCGGHYCWHLQEGSGHDFDAGLAASVGNPLLAIYTAIDDAVGALTAEAGGADVMVYLSHGMEHAHTGSRLLDRILARLNGELNETRNAVLTQARRVWRMLPTPVRHALQPLHLPARDRLYAERDLLPGAATRRCHEVYCADRSSGVRISLAGRDPGGKVRPEDYEAYCDWLIAELLAVRNDDTGEPLVSEITRTRDDFHGPLAGILPDLLVVWNRDAPIVSVSSPTIGRLRHPHATNRVADHRPGGLFMLSGPGFSPRRLNDDVPVIDLAPSLAALVGVRQASFQGTPLEQLVPVR